MLKRTSIFLIILNSISFTMSPLSGVEAAVPSPITKSDDEFLDKIERDTFKFFWEKADPKTAGFNVDVNWWSKNYIGIDQGVTILMFENYRTGIVWECFMQSPYIRTWIELCLTEK